MKISNLKRTKDGAVRVELDDGTAFPVSDGSVIELGLCAGLELDEGAYEALKSACEKRKNRSYALRTVSVRALSEKELRTKLSQRGCGDEETESIILWLENLGAVSDDALAENLVRHYSRKNYGNRGIVQMLRKRGIDRETILKAMENAGDGEGSLDDFVAAKLRGKTPDRKELNRLAQMLLRRGHEWSDIREALGKYENNPEDEF